MASPSTSRRLALLDQDEVGERLCWTWRISVRNTASGSRIAGLMRPRLLLSAAAFTHRDQLYCLVGPHAAHGSGGVHRP
jgi:hypothetical protein